MEKVILAVVLALALLVVISWAADGFAFKEITAQNTAAIQVRFLNMGNLWLLMLTI